MNETETEPKPETWVAVNKDREAFVFQLFTQASAYAQNRPTTGPWLIAKVTHTVKQMTILEEV